MFTWKNVRNFDEMGQMLLFFMKTRFSQNHTGTDFFFKNEARMLKFGLVLPLYSI